MNGEEILNKIVKKQPYLWINTEPVFDGKSHYISKGGKNAEKKDPSGRKAIWALSLIKEELDDECI